MGEPPFSSQPVVSEGPRSLPFLPRRLSPVFLPRIRSVPMNRDTEEGGPCTTGRYPWKLDTCLMDPNRVDQSRDSPFLPGLWSDSGVGLGLGYDLGHSRDLGYGRGLSHGHGPGFLVFASDLRSGRGLADTRKTFVLPLRAR